MFVSADSHTVNGSPRLCLHSEELKEALRQVKGTVLFPVIDLIICGGMNQQEFTPWPYIFPAKGLIFVSGKEPPVLIKSVQLIGQSPNLGLQEGPPTKAKTQF